MSLAEFQAAALRWVLSEELAEVKSPGNTAQLNSFLDPAFSDDYADILSARQSSFNTLDRAKLSLVNELQSNGADTVAALAIANQAKLIDDISDIIDDFEAKFDALDSALNNTPERYLSKPASDNFLDTLNKVRASFKELDDERGISPESTLQPLVDNGLVTQEALDDYLQDKSFASGRGGTKRVQVVNELRERYYTVDPVGYESIRLEGLDQFKLVDEDGNEVEELTGLGTGDLQENGDIVFRGNPDGPAQNATKTITITPTSRQKRSRGGGSRRNLRSQLSGTVSPADTLSQVGDTVEEEFRYEIWACLVLQASEYLINMIFEIKVKLQQALLSFKNLNFLLEGTILGDIADKSADAFARLSRAKNEVDNLLSPGPLAADLLRNQLSFITPSGELPGVNNICNFNHAQYCRVKFDMDEFFKNILGWLDAFQINLGFDVPSFGLADLIDLLSIFYDQLFEELELLDEFANQLRGMVCSFVQNKKKGSPKVTPEIKASIIALRLIIASAPALDLANFSISIPPNVELLLNQLNKAGYIAAATKLAKGDIKGFLRLDEEVATEAGEVAFILEQEAYKTSSRQDAADLNRLASASRARGQQFLVAQRVREGVRERFNNKVGSIRAKQVQKEGTLIIAKGQRERS